MLASQVTGNKALDKKSIASTEFPGGLKETNFEKLVAHKPEENLSNAL